MNAIILSHHLVAYPIFQVVATYCYRKVSTPTVFDELLMSLAQDFPQLKNNSLGQITELLQLDEVFIHHTLKNLLETGLIERHDFKKNLTQIQLSELQLTENGKKFYHEKKMLGKPHKEKENFFFNPLTKSYEKDREKDREMNKNKASLQLNKNLFPLNDDTLKMLSINAIKLLDKITSDVSFEESSISHNTELVQWQKVEIDLVLDHNHNLIIECKDEVFSKWLETRSSNVILENIIQPILANAEVTLQKREFLNYDSDKLCSMTLADQKLNLDMIKNAVIIRFTNITDYDDKPCIIFNNSYDKATLHGQVLFIPFIFEHHQLSINASQLFFDFNSQKIWIEEEGLLQCYFDRQSQYLPIRILIESQSDWIQKLSAFQEPNLDTLAFMANFLAENEIIAKMPMLTIKEMAEFKEKITKIWNKNRNFTPEFWIEKILLLKNEDDMSLFNQIFPNLQCSLKRLDKNLWGKLLDNALKELNVTNKFDEFEPLLKMTKTLQKLSAKKLLLKEVNLETLQNIKRWQEYVNDFSLSYSIHSEELEKKSKNFTQCKQKINDLFEPLREEEKFAILDTNYLLNHSQKLATIVAERHVIFPKTVIYELEKLKQENKNALIELGQKNSKEQSLLVKQKEQQLQNFGYKLREALNKINELKLTVNTESENKELLAMITEQEQATADDKILTVAAKYKLNDVLLYTADKGMKAKAISIGLKTSS